MSFSHLLLGKVLPAMASQVLTNAIVPATSTVPSVEPKAPSPMVEIVPVKQSEAQAMVLPAPSLNIIFTREGDIIKGTGHIINGGKIEVLTASVNLRHLGAYLRASNALPVHDKVGDFLGIGSALKSIAKSTIVRSLVKATKGIIKSKELGAAIGGLAVVFPPVGLPAAGAYASANVALKYIENGNKAIKRGQELLKSGKGLTAKDKQRLELAISRKKRAQEKLKKVIAKSKQPPNPKLKEMQKAVQQENKKLRAEKSPKRYIPPVSPREHAKIIGLVHQSRQRIANVHRSLAVPLAVNIQPRVVRTPIGKNDPIVVVWRKYLRSHPVKAQKTSPKKAA